VLTAERRRGVCAGHRREEGEKKGENFYRKIAHKKVQINFRNIKGGST